MAPEEDIDPYRPPSAAVGPAQHDEASRGPLYSPGQVTGATFLGSPLAGFWLLASNYNTLGRADKKQQAWIWGAATTIAVSVLAFFLPENFPSYALAIGYTLGLQHLAKQWQGEAFQRHLADGGEKHSSWRAAGIGFASLLIVLVIVMAIAFALPESMLPN